MPSHSASTILRSRVTPGWSSTMATRLPTVRLTKVDFPTLGRPTTATTGASITDRSRSRARRRAMPSVGTTSTGRGRSAGVVPSRKRPSDRQTSGSR